MHAACMQHHVKKNKKHKVWIDRDDQPSRTHTHAHNKNTHTVMKFVY